MCFVCVCVCVCVSHKGVLYMLYMDRNPNPMVGCTMQKTLDIITLTMRDNRFSLKWLNYGLKKMFLQDSMAMRVANGLHEISSFFRHNSKERFCMLQQHEKECCTSLVSLQWLQECYPHYVWITEQLGTTKQELVLL